MLRSIGNLFGGKAPQKGGPGVPNPFPNGSPLRGSASDRQPVYSKVFRWRVPSAEASEPLSVEVVGSFTQWSKVPLTWDKVTNAWHVSLNNIQGNRTHHYMLLVNGKPTYDKNCDGLAVPRGPDEERFQLVTEKGPRVFMLFAQTK